MVWNRIRIVKEMLVENICLFQLTYNNKQGLILFKNYELTFKLSCLIPFMHAFSALGVYF